MNPGITMLGAGALLLSGCAAIAPALLAELATPERIEQCISLAVNGVKRVLSPESKATLNQAANDLDDIDWDNMTEEQIKALLKELKVKVPSSYQLNYDAAVECASWVINDAIRKFGVHSSKVMAYTKAVSSGLKASF